MTDHTPLTEQQLDEIEARANTATPGPWCTVGAEIFQGAEYTPDVSPWIGETCRASGGMGKADAAFVAHARTDVPALVAEVRRLRSELATALRPNTPRLCACGHSNLAHTVPAPHYCFAHGQTCSCPAYRQLPHDEAVAQLRRNQAAAVPAAGVTGE